jgi:predicted glycosyltransferase
MRIWLDFLTPKQLLFLSEIGRKLTADGYDVMYTTRRYREVDELVKIRHIEATVAGAYGGATLEGKLAASAHRIEELSHIIGPQRPDVSLAFASPEAARTAFGLAIPHYTVNDSPHSRAVAKLTIPLADRLFSPAVISKRTWLKLGATMGQITQYKGLDPLAWLTGLVPNKRVLEELGLNDSTPIIVFRAEESFASYLVGKAPHQSVTVPIVKDLLDTHGHGIGAQVVVLARYPEQVPAVRKALPEEVVVPSKAVDGPSLLSFASLFVGAGGTMTTEAALLGVPALSCYPGEPTIVERYLIRQGLVKRVTNPSRASATIRRVLSNLEDEHRNQGEKARSLVEKMENPAEVVARSIREAFPP